MHRKYKNPKVQKSKLARTMPPESLDFWFFGYLDVDDVSHSREGLYLQMSNFVHLKEAEKSFFQQEPFWNPGTCCLRKFISHEHPYRDNDCLVFLIL